MVLVPFLAKLWGKVKFRYVTVHHMMKNNQVTDALLGLAVGDALGVPVEFMTRANLQQQPVTGMQGYGTHHQPPGTWSDDSSLAFCLAESLCHGYDLRDMATRFVNWQRQGYWAAHGQVFDIGMATSVALHKIATGTDPIAAGGTRELGSVPVAILCNATEVAIPMSKT